MLFGKRNTLENAFADVQCASEEKEKRKRRSILRQLSQLSRRSFDSLSSSLSSPRTPSPRSTFSDYPNACELILLSAVQAHQFSSDEKRNCACEVQNLINSDKQKLINFFKAEGDASGVIENNAFKTFHCSNLTTECLLENVQALNELWSNLQEIVVPTLQSMCYPLQDFDSSFNIQKLILTAFRDRVLAKLLQDVNHEIPEIRSVLLAILLETDDVSTILQSKIDICLGKTTISKPRYLKKTRSKTDSCLSNKRKSVSWVDDMQANRKSYTFCS